MSVRRLVLPLALIMAVLAQVNLDGCTLGLTGLGAMIDSSKPDSLYVRAWRIDTLKVGTRVTLWMKDGSRIPGVFQGFAREAEELYAPQYAAFLEHLPARSPFPSPGDTITLATTGGTRSGRLVAYDYNSIVVWEENAPAPTTRMARNLMRIRFDGTSASPDSLWEWLRSSRAPFLSSICLGVSGVPGSNRLVPPADVYRVQYANVKRGAATGAILGLCVDVTALVVILIATGHDEEHYTPPPSSGESSCPYLYSYDGRDFVLDAEAFSGAIMRSRQATDGCMLDHLQAVDGTCRVRLANRLQETQFVDALAVVAVDHPPDAEVLPSAPGQFCTITAPQAPLAATDYAGCVVTDLIAAQDDLGWLSNPAGRDPDNPAALRDGLILRFQRPAAAERAKLVLTLQNTPWLLEMEHHLMGLGEPMLGLWYAQLNTFAGPRERFDEVLQREAGLRVDLWDGQGWQVVDHLPFVGTAVARSVVLPLDLTPPLPDEIRIRLECTPGFWIVDRAQADFTPDLPLRVTSLTLRSATQNAIRDVREDLTAIDGTYDRLEQGDEADVVFAAPPPSPGWERSYGVLCTGYYTVDVTPAPQPQWALLRRLGQEPGAFSAYTIERINGWLERADPAGQAALLLPPR